MAIFGIVMKRLALALTLALCACSAGQKDPAPVGPVPTAEQVAWHQDEVWAFVHFGLNTFTDKEWGYGDTDPSLFDPSDLDCEQWVRTFAAAGIKGVIVTAKHHDGFCLWPSKYTDYSVAASPYKDGKGDIVGELSEACAKYGLKMGVYLSPWDRHQACYGTAEYVEYYHNQLCELLSSYGRISEVWLDGANGGDGWYGGANEKRSIDATKYYDYQRIAKEVEDLQPGAVIFSDGGPGCRWVGNENGQASETDWAFLRGGEVYPGYPKYWELGEGHADGDAWIPAECDVSIRKGWFWHDDGSTKSAERLAELYYESVGRGGKLLLNFPPDRRGLIPETDSLAAVQARGIIDSELGENLLIGAKVTASGSFSGKNRPVNALDGSFDTYWAARDTSATLEMSLPEAQVLERLALQEYIPLGQRVKAFRVEYSSDGEGWLQLPVEEKTTTVGYKRILRFPGVMVKSIRIIFEDSRACPCISEVAAYGGSL